MSTEKVTYKALNSANVRIDNSVDADRVYDISANVNVDTTSVSGMDGEIRAKGDSSAVVATFNSWNGNLGATYQGITPEEQQTVNAAINTFIEDVNAKVQSGSPVSVSN